MDTIYKITYDTQWGSRGVRKKHSFYMVKRPRLDSVLSALGKRFGEIRREAISIKPITITEGLGHLTMYDEVDGI